ncbi:50S ribosomal protein L18 [Alphaproteobacteria bacterium]|nr:50S ribosomal protein L18 [Alphaproteobacteria bacterium]
MSMQYTNNHERRKIRQRYKIAKVINGRCRLVVHKSNNHVYAQVLDESGKSVIASASSLLPEIKKTVKHTGNVEAALAVGKVVAQKAKEKNITKVVFDRSGFLFHGRIKALADSARENGLEI